MDGLSVEFVGISLVDDLGRPSLPSDYVYSVCNVPATPQWLIYRLYDHGYSPDPKETSTYCQNEDLTRLKIFRLATAEINPERRMEYNSAFFNVARDCRREGELVQVQMLVYK